MILCHRNSHAEKVDLFRRCLVIVAVLLRERYALTLDVVFPLFTRPHLTFRQCPLLIRGGEGEDPIGLVVRIAASVVNVVVGWSAGCRFIPVAVNCYCRQRAKGGIAFWQLPLSRSLL
jgi:hypothetical protein